MTQHARRMADEGGGFVCRHKALDQRDRRGILGQIPQRAMTAGIKTASKSPTDTSESCTVSASRAMASASASKRWVASVWKSGSLLLGSSGGCPPWAKPAYGHRHP
jgi:hypothetical protein